MLFHWKATDSGYWYQTNGVFGTIEITSTNEIEKERLDDIVQFLIHKSKASTGTVQIGDNTVSFTFEREPQWSEDDEEEKPAP